MKNIIEIINNYDNTIKGKPAAEPTIEQAERTLGLKFAADYRKYVSSFSCMSIGCREFTGITDIPNYDVVAITQTQKEYYHNIPDDWYVIEQLNIDRIVIWQSTSGEIYQTSPNCDPEKICNSLIEYIETNQ